VSAGWYTNDNFYVFFKHNHRLPSYRAYEHLKETIDNTTELVAHNIKFELLWLKAINMPYRGKIADTMIREYVLSRGQKLAVSLEDSCIRNNVVAHKKSELVNHYMKNNIGFEEIPPEIVEEYGRADVEACRGLYYNQIERLNKSSHLWPTVYLMEDFCKVLVDMEYNGISIDTDILNSLDDIYTKEYNEIEIKLNNIIKEVMGDTPISLDSPEQLSWLLYSRKVTDKNKWKEIFDIGSELRGSVRKTKRPIKMSKTEFVNYVRLYTEPIYKTIAERCEACEGRGTYVPVLSSGALSKSTRKCKTCGGTGVCYKETSDIAGFKFIPNSSEEVKVGGFSSDKERIFRLGQNATGNAKAFIELFKRFSQLSTYKDTFIDSIKRNCGADNFLHPNFNQCITATGRLSTSNPNTQNIPRSGTFDIKRCFVSRFKEGILTEADARQLEFRIAGELSGDEKIYEDVINGTDVHSVTASHTGLSRQESKAHTFAPIYGATDAGKDPNIAKYYMYFKDHYKGLSKAHEIWSQKVLDSGGFFRLPSGREYYYPNTIRYFNGSISNSTIIKNYPVQGFATADIIPLWFIETWELFNNYRLKSLILLNVHDSILIDTYPTEKDIVINVVKEAWYNATKIKPKLRWNYEIKMPLEIEVKQGINWFEMKEV
jgi:DNA polymerase I-like protein with 3'-5' exonuclease and polymerase domains